MTNLFVRFLGEFEDTKSPFEIILPLVEPNSKNSPKIRFNVVHGMAGNGSCVNLQEKTREFTLGEFIFGGF